MSDSYRRFDTDPISLQPLVETGPDQEGPLAPLPEWMPTRDAPVVPQPTAMAPWSLFVAIVSLAGSFFVGWGLPIALCAIVLAVLSLRRPADHRPTARWALVLGFLAAIYSAGWLLWAAGQL